MFSYCQTTTEYSCGVDLHSRQMYICVMDKNGEVQVPATCGAMTSTTF